MAKKAHTEYGGARTITGDETKIVCLFTLGVTIRLSFEGKIFGPNSVKRFALNVLHRAEFHELWLKVNSGHSFCSLIYYHFLYNLH